MAGAASGGAGAKADGIDLKCINTVRLLSADMVQKANSGHPGAPMGCAPMAHVLWGNQMNYDPSQPKWINRDRFVLSNGHSCALLYSMLHVTGHSDMTMDDLKAFRQLGSRTAGHPENELHPAIEVSTGPLGQGISNAVGMALAQKNLAATYNKEGHEIFDSNVFVICGDGCLQEGISSEASSLAGHWGLGSLVVLYDDNKITIDGSTELSFTEDVAKRYEAYGWHVQVVEDGDEDIGAIQRAVEEAKKETSRPSIIKVSTRIGFGSSKVGTAGVHGSPLGDEVLAATKEKFGFDPKESFVVAEDVLAYYKEAAERGVKARQEWDAAFEAYKAKFPEEGAEIERRFKGELPADIVDCLPRYTPADKKEATRSLSGKALNALAEKLPELFGGSADLTPSNKTLLKITGDFQKDTPAGRYIRFGVREHGMTAIANGIMAFGGHLPFVATFLNFIGYAAGAVRVSALSHFRVLFVATHDSIGLGEDGPTHQPVEMLLMLRGMPHMDVYRPADGNEVSASYGNYATRPGHPAVVALSRQGLPQLEGSSVEAAMKGGYTLQGGEGEGQPDVILCASGSEVSLCVEAAKALQLEGGAAAGKKVAIVSLPCQEVFLEQDPEYRASVFPKGTPVLTVEASCSLGWERFGHGHHGVDTFGLSGPGPAVYEHFKLTPDGIAAKAAALMARFEGAAAPAVPATLPEL